MPQTACPSTMFAPSGMGPPLASGEEPPQEGPGPGTGFSESPPISSASLDTLIQHLVPTTDYYPEKAYVFTFLLSSRLFIPPHELLARVCQLCIQQQHLEQMPLDAAKVKKFGPKILQLLTEWAETFPSDFREEKMVAQLKDLVHRIAPCDEAYRKKLNQVLQNLNAKLAAMAQGDEGIVKVTTSVSDKLVAFKTKPAPLQKDMISICNDPFTLAQQLTHIELEHLRHIGPEEFVQAFVQKDPLDTTKPCFSEQSKSTTNLEAYVRWFNRLCYLVATEICMPAKKKQRALVIEFFIDVARECFNIGNFNSLMAIISGMNMSPVSRLKKTWAKAKTAKFFILEHQMDPTGNFYNYRTALRGAAHRSHTAHSNREKIVIPFFSLLIKDIYFLNESCSNRLPNGHVNFEKFVELARQVGEFMAWKQMECPYEEERSILHYLHTAPIFNEDGLYLASYESESPENQVEKDRWKALRSSILGKT
ncbi:ras-GEF domain-containing family member 1C [Clupea harengus]|uniref:Ras-GEF domain-containing family member 1C n=1 Tax=Clupea harengus TaxID=7950 RepID=A0A6P3WFH8_CLUHA|nr:ras-GEF domain-containing family member 1C [Clupea harengus]XP_031443265.1 ras-GEF domain-containing family member 1C [Clupea harengus]XP_031443266.1 ras-GEF domain-containing family member 1C [Clupea harengus]XP_031443267.1 ras-GEF domain-containing family member 1C [Clupea harengus]